MPEVKDSEGNIIAKLPYTEEGEEMAQDMKEANPSLDIDYAPGGTYDGGGRVKLMYAGGGKTGYNAIGAEKPMYKEGGEVIPEAPVEEAPILAKEEKEEK